MFFKFQLKRKLLHVEKLVGVKNSNTLCSIKTKVVSQLGKHQGTNSASINEKNPKKKTHDLFRHNLFLKIFL